MGPFGMVLDLPHCIAIVRRCSCCLLFDEWWQEGCLEEEEACSRKICTCGTSACRSSTKGNHINDPSHNDGAFLFLRCAHLHHGSATMPGTCSNISASPDDYASGNAVLSVTSCARWLRQWSRLSAMTLSAM